MQDSWLHSKSWIKFVIKRSDKCDIELLNTNYFAKSSLQKDLCREALTWRSISHPFILPFLGIYKDKSTLHLVSPFMMNGTLTRWRQTQRPDVVEIHRVVRPAIGAVEQVY